MWITQVSLIKFYLKYFVLNCFIYSISADAQKIEKDIFDLTFEELLEVNIDLATKTSESLSSVPSSITVFNEQHIINLGIQNAYDIVNFVPGFQITRGDWVGAVPKEHARGVFLDNGYILVMVNGERLNEVSFGKASVYTPYIPATIVQRIEFIRGPGSALYGSNAFLGVMNIITKNNSNKTEFSVGNNGSWGGSASWHKDFENEFNTYINFAIDKKQGENYYPSENFVIKDPLASIFLELGIKYDKLSFSTRFNQVELNKFLNLGGYSLENTHRSDNTYVKLNYQWYDSAKTSLSTRLLYGIHHISSAGMVLPKEAGIVSHDFLVGPYWSTDELTFNVDHQIKVLPDLILSSGVELRRAKQFQAGVVTSHFDYQINEAVPDNSNYLNGVFEFNDTESAERFKKSINANAVYTQLKWLFLQDLTFFIGGRYDDVVDIENKFSPRAAMVYQGIDDHSLKLQYGESYRTPVTNELYSSDDVTTGNPDLTSEFVKTSELVWAYKNKHLTTEIVVFHNKLKDFINKVPDQSGEAEFTFQNNINKDITGSEMAMNWQINPSLEMGLTGTQLFDKPINASFKRFFNTFVNYRSGNWLTNLNVIIRDELTAKSSNNIDFYMPSYAIWSSTLLYQVSEKVKLSLKVNNLFNKTFFVFDPRVNNGKIPGKSRQISFGINYQY